MEVVQLVLALMGACVLLALLARRLQLPYAVVLILAGMVLAFIPGVPVVTLDPALALAFFLPPLLQGSAYRTDWKAFRRDLRPILLLAVGAVIFTAFLMGALARVLVPEMPWAAALALGAILAPPDAVAAAAVLQRLNLPRRLVTLLEGESLMNDATALVLYRFAIAAAAVGTLAPHMAAASFLAVAAGGVVVGWLVARATLWALARLNDTLLETALSFLACYGAFLAAEALSVSGVLAVVTTGIMLSRAQYRVLSARTRIETRVVWQFVEFVLTSLVFILIGLQLRAVLEGLAGRGVGELAWLAFAVSAGLIASRFLWVFVAGGAQALLGDRMPVAQLTVLSWAGMRGVVSLAAAIALPLDFPERELIVFLAFCAILATLVVQGTTLGWLIRRLGLVQPPHRDGINLQEAALRHQAARAMLGAIETRATDVLYGPMAQDLLAEHRDRAAHLERVSRGGGAASAERAARRALRLEGLEAARAVLREHHARGDVPEDILTKLAEELDYEENRLRRALG
ncbi:CPA1 family monovalent cation:H+ antiporter [Roseococcus suduntuyensis]|uniref:CPA1 family monovalent cation:H+ antiporter n=1 Tax=Roseococcus suduntuyensis TaxID=455361 RepID=A0A840AE30_9PROT|nr:Na+/H+ antiporter [Roseococcus suduntuyensis]MBB3898335.1 CPA1 family monovalent cation:H+ antiporter [Roseococcus suduntuyensis]